jgi:hypothetical protein
VIIALEVWLFINLCGFFLIVGVAHSDGMWSPLIYPVLDDYLDNYCRMNKPWKKALKVMFTIVFAPALFVYFFAMTMYVLLLTAIYAITKKK